ncbi:MAG: lipase family protein [Candidatus Cloacimonadaceae bacterium]|nr:lipase family protein [Candidatus Cloacimonadaceae bacterium]
MPDHLLRPLPKMTDAIIFPPNMDYDYFSIRKDHPFPPVQTDFDPAICWWLSEFSLIAYEHPNFIRLAMDSILDMKTQIVNNNNFRCVVAYDDELIVVAFRGTQIKSIGMLKDLSYGVLVKPVFASDYGKLHQGFFDSYQRVWLDCELGARNIVRKLKHENPQRRLWFTGHSLGGVIAVLAAIESNCQNPVYTFGCPKFGDREFARKLGIRHFRMVNRDDIVVRFPPRFSKYIGHDVYYIDGEVFQISDKGIAVSTIEDKSLLKYIFDLWKTNRNAVFKLIFWGIPASAVRYLLRFQVLKFVSILSDAMQELLFKYMVDHAPVLYAISAYNYLISNGRGSASNDSGSP